MSPHRTPGPIVCVTTWEIVMQGAGWRCQCSGGSCGSQHSQTGLRCDRQQNGTVRLLAAPADLTLPTLAAARVPVTELRAWCPTCHKKAQAKQQRSDRERQRLDRQQADDSQGALF